MSRELFFLSDPRDTKYLAHLLGKTHFWSCFKVLRKINGGPSVLFLISTSPFKIILPRSLVCISDSIVSDQTRVQVDPESLHETIPFPQLILVKS